MSFLLLQREFLTYSVKFVVEEEVNSVSAWYKNMASIALITMDMQMFSYFVLFSNIQRHQSPNLHKLPKHE